MALPASVRRAFVRSLAVLLASAAGAAGWSSFALSFPLQEGWTSHGGNASNPCDKDPNTGQCKVFGSAEEAALSTLGGLHCHSPVYHALWAYPNDFWRMDGNQSANCNSYQYSNFVRRYFAQASCPDTSTQSGSECACNSGSIEVSGPNAAVGPSCHGGKNNGQPCPSCGNPINPASGNKYQREPIYAGPHGLSFELVYNSQDTVTASFGPRWRGSFDRSIKAEGSNVLVLRQDGKAALYTPSGGTWTTDADVSDVLTELQAGGVRTGWQLQIARTDDVEMYDAAGKLLSIQFRSGLSQTLTYSDGTSGPNGGYLLGSNGFQTGYVLPAGYLIRVTDSFGRTLSFSYEVNKYLARMVAGGATYSFGYVKRQLRTVTFPDSRTRQYVYGELAHTGGLSKPYALTGIVDEKGQRFATYKYDAQGRAVSTEHAGATNQHAIVYNTDGSADVTDPRGETRNFTFQNILGALKPTGITGSPSPAGGAPVQGHDANGNVTSRTDWNGNRTDYTYDLARNLETSRTEGLTASGAATPETRTITTAWHTTFRLPTQIAEPLRATTFTYAGRTVLEEHPGHLGRERQPGLRRYAGGRAAHVDIHLQR
jgi:YD repeat-containing protein